MLKKQVLLAKKLINESIKKKLIENHFNPSTLYKDFIFYHQFTFLTNKMSYFLNADEKKQKYDMI